MGFTYFLRADERKREERTKRKNNSMQAASTASFLQTPSIHPLNSSVWFPSRVVKWKGAYCFSINFSKVFPSHFPFVQDGYASQQVQDRLLRHHRPWGHQHQTQVWEVSERTSEGQKKWLTSDSPACTNAFLPFTSLRLSSPPLKVFSASTLSGLWSGRVTEPLLPPVMTSRGPLQGPHVFTST